MRVNCRAGGAPDCEKPPEVEDELDELLLDELELLLELEELELLELEELLLELELEELLLELLLELVVLLLELDELLELELDELLEELELEELELLEVVEPPIGPLQLPPLAPTPVTLIQSTLAKPPLVVACKRIRLLPATSDTFTAGVVVQVVHEPVVAKT
jgi:hypothetical protein